MPIRQVADGFYADVKAKPSPASVAASARSVLDMITKAATPVTKTMTDTPPARATYKMRMNQFVAPGIDVGLDGQTMAYVRPDAKKARQIFASKYVPMSDGTELLHGCNKKTMSQRGYGNVPDSKLEPVTKTMRIGFNNTLVDTSNGKITACEAPVIHYANTAVKSDFPKGPGGAAPNKMWEDGTYEEMFAKVSKEYPAVHERIKFKAPTDRRRKIFNLQALTGAEVFGDAMLKKTLQESFAEDRMAELRTAAKSALPTATEAQLDQAVQGLRIARRQQEIARRLKLPETAPLVVAAAAAELRAEQAGKGEREALAANLAGQAEERHEVDVARVREARRARVARGLEGERLGRVREQVAQTRQALATQFREALSEQLQRGRLGREGYAPIGRRTTPAEAATTFSEASAPISSASARRQSRREEASRGGGEAITSAPTSSASAVSLPGGLSIAEFLRETRGKGRPVGGHLSPEELAFAAKRQKARAREAAISKRAQSSGEYAAALREAGLEPEEVFQSSRSGHGRA